MKIGLTPQGERILRMSVVEAVEYNPGEKILDLCCGTGTLTVFLAQLIPSDCKIIGVDISAGQIRQANKKNQYPNLKFEVMDAANLLFNNEIFDKVIISAALHEMESSLRLKVLAEVHRILKLKSDFIIFDHHEPRETGLRILYNFYLGFWEKLLSNSFEMQRHILMELKNAGFKIVKQTQVKKFLKFFQVIVAKR